MYDKKLKEYKSKQAKLLEQMNAHSLADQEYHLTAARLLDVCKRAEEIFKSSEPAEKRVFLNFVLQNSVLNARKPVFTLKPVFQGIVKAHDDHKWGRIVEDVRTRIGQQNEYIYIPDLSAVS
jgi:hypothetical protein